MAILGPSLFTKWHFFTNLGCFFIQNIWSLCFKLPETSIRDQSFQTYLKEWGCKQRCLVVSKRLMFFKNRFVPRCHDSRFVFHLLDLEDLWLPYYKWDDDRKLTKANFNLEKSWILILNKFLCWPRFRSKYCCWIKNTVCFSSEVLPTKLILAEQYFCFWRSPD